MSKTASKTGEKLKNANTVSQNWFDSIAKLKPSDLVNPSYDINADDCPMISAIGTCPMLTLPDSVDFGSYQIQSASPKKIHSDRGRYNLRSAHQEVAHSPKDHILADVTNTFRSKVPLSDKKRAPNPPSTRIIKESAPALPVTTTSPGESPPAAHGTEEEGNDDDWSLDSYEPTELEKWSNKAAEELDARRMQYLRPLECFKHGVLVKVSGDVPRTTRTAEKWLEYPVCTKIPGESPPAAHGTEDEV